MSVRMAPPLPLILLLMIQGVYSDDDWGAIYSSSHICALKGSTVTVKCTYTYPTGHKIIEAYWTNSDWQIDNTFPDLSKDSEYRERIQYLGDKQNDCSVRLTDVRHTDSHEYYFRFITNETGGRWTGTPGVTLAITDLQVESEGETVIEGHSVTLTCKSRCSLTDTSTFIWFRNTQTLNDTNNKLILPSVRRENTGDYSCAVQGHKLTSSPPRRLNVIYPPDNPVISISSSGVIVEGDSVNLTCSSESNPPANISWFKGETSVGSGNIYRISNIRSDHSGQYKCKTKNKLGEKYSDPVTLNITSVRCVSLFVFFGVGVCGTLATLLVVMYIWRKSLRRKASKPKPEKNDVNNDTYTALELKTRSSDLYDTLTPNRKMMQ